jgi:hypothetical protein
MTDGDWSELGELVGSILAEIYVKHRKRFERLAAKRCITLEELASAAIIEAVRQRLSPTDRNGQ